jgi:hypothetical protein
MTDPSPLFESPTALAAAATVVALTVAIAWRRRTALPVASCYTAVAGLVLLALAAGGPTWPRPAAGEVAVMVDLSPSTRGAAYRDRAALARRVDELLGSTPHRLYTFAGGPPSPASADASRAAGSAPPAESAGASDTTLADLPADQTVYAPPAGAAAVLLFSDGRFALPADAPPTYAVVDPQLAVAADARVTSLRIDGLSAAAQVDSTSAPRTLTWSGTAAGVRRSATGMSATSAARPAGQFPTNNVADPISPGSYVLRRLVAGGTEAGGARVPAVTARLSPGDAWPENDALTIAPPAPDRLERWLVTAGPATPAGRAAPLTLPGFRVMSPAELPSDPAAYLAAAVVVLDNVPADAVPPAARDRLTQYVRDLGGGLAIAGGDRAFAAGGYVGTPLDALSPLASTPPRPTARWLLLTDGSGSMAAAGGAADVSRWQAATDALVRLVPALPPDDAVDVGSFAETLTLWSAGRSARATRDLPLPPAGVAPRGPTNLRPALEAAVGPLPVVPTPAGGGGSGQAPPSSAPAPSAGPTSTGAPVPVNLLLLSDADADVGDVPSLVALLASRNVRLHLLAVDAGRGLADLQAVGRRTGGQAVRQDDPARWASAAGDLLRAAAETRLSLDPAAVTFAGRLANLPGRAVSPWNRTWIKPRADEVGRAVVGGEPVPMAAAWDVGEGRVAAAAFAAAPTEVAALAAAVARPPRDPRVTVAWDAGRAVRVRVDVVDLDPAATQPYGNGVAFSLDVTPDGAVPRQVPLRQTAPGRYEGELPAPGSPAVATVRQAGRAVAREAVAGRYPPEFDAVGVDRAALGLLAGRSAGRVIEPTERRPIEFRWPRRDVPLAPWLASAGACLILAALLWWKWS